MADSQTATSAPEFKSAHFIGIGGAGMSGIALVLHERGYAVTGSDLKTSRYIRQLTRAGVEVHVGHEAATIDEVKPDVVVVSTAIPESNLSSCALASWAFPCGPVLRCSLLWGTATLPLPLPARMARPPRLRCAPPCSTAWVWIRAS